jgi:hypothetical protein
MRRLVTAPVVALVVVLVSALILSACGSSGDSSKVASTLPPKVIQITFNGDTVNPNGTDIAVRVGQPLEFDVTADKPGEIHVHSSPQEQEFHYGKGSTRISVTAIQAPGRITVESHTLNKTLFILIAQ